MVEEIRMQILREGVVIEDVSAVIPAMPDGTPASDALAAAFIDHHGKVMIDNPDYDPSKEDGPGNVKMVDVPLHRNITTRIRKYCERELANYMEKLERSAADLTVKTKVNAVVNAISVKENM